ncbi:hypothetical protein AMS68_001893 [Peltaster fructicola]|uniref:PWWP domain-containing protein n=1 Tax=Peltaster fructicola TaxID=286661 RepID=A0A6H0XNW7_9PEZI|nr:hypothetical protein AMS68_001893 [Peltaster fructicola]
MADTAQSAAPLEHHETDKLTEQAQANGDAPAAKEDDEDAGAVVTAEVNAPDGDGTAEAVEAATEENGTAGSKDKKRKSSSGVPEHKSKKLNRKKSMTTLNLDCKPGDYYWARLKGYPNWPAIIADEQMLPETLLATRPVSTERADGSLREDYQDGGKNAKDRTYPIMFLGTNEFAWMPNTSLSKLDPEECKSKTSKLSKSLSAAYDLAVEHPDLDYFKNLLQQFQEETAVWESEQRQREAEAAEKAAAKAEKDAATKEKKARKSKGGDEDVEMADADAPKSSKKRKKDATEGDDEPKAKKTPKITKLNAPKTNGESSKKDSVSKPKKKVAAPKADPDTTEQKPEMTEAEKLQAREKHVLYLRHRLQKAFLSSDAAPKEDEMTGMNEFFVNLESYEDLEPAIIRTTKIHKVLKAIIKLNTVPKDDEYQFKKRSQTMLEAWNKRMEANGEVASKPAEEKTTTTNGDSKSKEEVEPEKAEEQADEIDKKVEKVDTSELKKETTTEDTKSGADGEAAKETTDAPAAETVEASA